MFHVKHAKSARQEGVWRGSEGGLTRVWAGQGPGWRGQAGVIACCLLAACSAPEESAAKTDPSAAATAAAPTESPSPPAAPTPASAKVEFNDSATRDKATREFAYSWPAAVAAVPELAARLTAERDKLLAEQKADWAEALKEFAGSDCVGCVNRDFAKVWEVVADIPGFLSLSQNFNAYTGGAHGNYGSGGLVWDRAAKQALAPQDLFVSEKALQDVLGTRWCKTLAAERRKRLGGEAGNDSTFPCPPIKDLTLLLGSKSKTHFDRIGLIADPYVAGSYAEGAYEVTLPVSQEVLTAVKPRYRAAFARGE